MDGCATGYCFHVPKIEWNVIVSYSVYGRLVQWAHCTQQHIMRVEEQCVYVLLLL